MTHAFLMMLYKLWYANVLSPFQQSTIMYAGFCHSYDLLKVPHTVQVQTALYLSMPPPPQSQTCSVRFYTIMLQAETSIHQQLVTKCKLTFLQCLNIESSTNGLPPCHKYIPQWPKRQLTHFYQYGLLFSLGISYDAIPNTGTLFWGWNGKISFHYQSHVQQEVITLAAHLSRHCSGKLIHVLLCSS